MRLIASILLLATCAYAEIGNVYDLTQPVTYENAGGNNWILRYTSSGAPALPDPFAWWKMTATGTNATQILDFSGNGNNASNNPTVATGPALVTTNGVFYRFDGSDDKFSVNNATGFNTPTCFTVTAWAYMTAEPNSAGNRVLYYHSTKNDAILQLIFTAKSGASHPIPQFRTKSVLMFGRITAPASCIWLASKTSPSINAWQFMTVVWDGGFASNSASYYLNGVKDTGFTTNQGSFVGITGIVANLTIGNNSLGNGSQFQGGIDDPRWYTNALTSNQIYQLYTTGRQ